MALTVARGVECVLVYAFQPEALHGGLCRPANDISSVLEPACGTETPHDPIPHPLIVPEHTRSPY